MPLAVCLFATRIKPGHKRTRKGIKKNKRETKRACEKRLAAIIHGNPTIFYRHMNSEKGGEGLLKD